MEENGEFLRWGRRYYFIITGNSDGSRAAEVWKRVRILGRSGNLAIFRLHRIPTLRSAPVKTHTNKFECVSVKPSQPVDFSCHLRPRLITHI
ncbi:hypothetical protein TcasGA2_TC010020 [Tribolium castaneum]|uniref:Uncharacterized protein n=1 Tax=Tribolium castaneum TaxID=7070 RepID=D6WRK0_TRICA|nr:hypothetical protein TcasGA2_TC010020 [Tribolium castaneum]